jgi:hypothetical protein
VDEKNITRGIEAFSEVVKEELRKRQRGVRDEIRARVALV